MLRRFDRPGRVPACAALEHGLSLHTFSDIQVWGALGQIVLIDILLGGDNAVVIALASRRLPAHQRRRAILLGTAGAVLLRVVLVAFALAMLQWPGLKLVGAALLLWIGARLLLDEEQSHGAIEAQDTLWDAVRIVLVADVVMSLDNVIALAGVAQSGPGKAEGISLIIFGLLLSVPIIVWGSGMVLWLMQRFPLIITLGAMMLGWIAGALAVEDPLIVRFLGEFPAWPFGSAGAAAVGAVGWWGARHRLDAHA